jgi:hypothetical protein
LSAICRSRGGLLNYIDAGLEEGAPKLDLQIIVSDLKAESDRIGIFRKLDDGAWKIVEQRKVNPAKYGPGYGASVERVGRLIAVE